MAARTFKVTAKTPRYRRNTTKLSFPATLFALAVLAAMLFSVPLLFINISRDGAGADSLPSPANVSSSLPIPVVTASSEGVPGTTTATAEQAREVYGRMPMSFEANRGQADESVNFVARGAGYTLALSPTAAVFQLRSADSGLRNGKNRGSESLARAEDQELMANQHSELRTPHSKVLRMNLVGANRNAEVAGLDELEGKVNYFIGNDPAKWHTDVPTFGRVRYAEVYPGIDVVYYGNQRRLEYDFVVAPGRDAGAIALEFAGAQKVSVDAATGDLLVRVGEETIRQHKPITYQETDTGRREVESRYALRDGGRVGFEVGEYDASAPLVIDPVLEYSTYLGGSDVDSGLHIVVDTAGNAYVTGRTASTNFPTVNPIDGTHGGGPLGDVFVTKINPDGSGLVYSTYLGGSGEDQGRNIAVDSAGNAYVTGVTDSNNFPTVSPIQGTFGGVRDAIVLKINPDGSGLVYSTYLGGAQHDFGFSIAVDSAGNAYVTGETVSANFPTVNPIDGTLGSDQFFDAFVTKINPNGSGLVYSTYLGGNGDDNGSDIAVDSAGNAYVTGPTSSTNFPTVNPIDGTPGGIDAFVTKINAAGTALLYSTYLGGADEDVGIEIAVDSAGDAYVSGYTESTNFPTVNPIDGTLSGATDAFVTKINATGTALVYSTYLGGTGLDI